MASIAALERMNKECLDGLVEITARIADKFGVEPYQNIGRITPQFRTLRTLESVKRTLDLVYEKCDNKVEEKAETVAVKTKPGKDNPFKRSK
ncbi:MAG: hypothetical protein HF312_15365 [Ignavibacteria bacterium]|jgi:hypothetical protein|nr:hypothetical protein [Ignavibacteria bacterium]